MSPMEKEFELLFAYGTLQSEVVQLSTFGRRLDGIEDALVGYRLRIIRIDDEDFVAASGTADHRNLEFTGYKRLLVQSRSGLNAWVYLKQA